MNHEPKQKSFEWVISEDKVLVKNEIKRLRRFCTNLKLKGLRLHKFFPIRNWFVVELGLSSGLRVEEMVKLKIKDILINKNNASVIVRKGKGGKRRAVKISDKFKHTCARFLKIRKRFCLSNDGDEYLLTSQKGNQLTKRGVWAQSFFLQILEEPFIMRWKKQRLRTSNSTI